MTQWLLMIQLAASFQTIGPVNDQAVCLSLQSQMAVHFKQIKTACVSVSTSVPQQQPPQAPK